MASCKVFALAEPHFFGISGPTGLLSGDRTRFAQVAHLRFRAWRGIVAYGSSDFTSQECNGGSLASRRGPEVNAGGP
jgi:hypothetical protein